jgi:hypothetical protein
MPHAPASPLARTSAAFPAVANARPGASLVAIILALLLRILARTEAAWSLPEDDEEFDEYEDEHGFDAYALLGVNPYALHPRPVGRAPHAIWVEAGLVADWILAGIRNRGMRPLPSPTPPARHTLPVRAPPRPTRPWGEGGEAQPPAGVSKIPPAPPLNRGRRFMPFSLRIINNNLQQRWIRRAWPPMQPAQRDVASRRQPPKPSVPPRPYAVRSPPAPSAACAAASRATGTRYGLQET